VNPNSADAHGALGWVLFHCGLHEDALREFQLALELDPSETLSLAHTALTLTALGRNEEAVQAFEQVVQSDATLLRRPDLRFSYEESKKAVVAAAKAKADR
jgi:tetratricopeptide (TPR) repeat protein